MRSFLKPGILALAIIFALSTNAQVNRKTSTKADNKKAVKAKSKGTNTKYGTTNSKSVGGTKSKVGSKPGQ